MCLPQKVSGETIQFIAAAIGSLQYLNFGLMFGISPLYGKLYQSATETPLTHAVSAVEVSWLSTYLFGGVAVGSLIFGMVKNKIGPKIVLVLSGLLQLTSWFCIHFAFHIQHIQASRAFNGVGFGAAFTVLPILIKEITKDANVAAKYIAFIDFSRALGILLGLVFSLLLPTVLVPIVGIAFSIAFTLLFPFVQDSPHYLLTQGNVVNMEKSLRCYRGIRHFDDYGKPEFVRELAEFTHEMQESHPIMVTSLPLGYKVKLGFFCFVLITCAQLSGVYFVLNYAMDLYADNNMALIFAGVQILGALFAIWFGGRINRKILLSLTGLVSGFSLIFLVVADKWQIVSTQSALTVSMAFLSLHILSASIGLQPVSVIVTQELLPLKLRAPYTSIISAISWLLLGAALQSYPYVSAYNLSAYFGVFAGACFLIVIIAFAFLPDTQTKSTEEVQRDMGFAVSENVARLSAISGGRIQENTYL